VPSCRRLLRQEEMRWRYLFRCAFDSPTASQIADERLRARRGAPCSGQIGGAFARPAPALRSRGAGAARTATTVAAAAAAAAAATAAAVAAA